jgi:hypothetical protein
VGDWARDLSRSCCWNLTEEDIKGEEMRFFLGGCLFSLIWLVNLYFMDVDAFLITMVLISATS